MQLTVDKVMAVNSHRIDKVVANSECYPMLIPVRTLKQQMLMMAILLRLTPLLSTFRHITTSLIDVSVLLAGAFYIRDKPRLGFSVYVYD